MTEKQLQTLVLQLATYCGWDHFHAYEMRRSDPGWPDLVLGRVPELMFVELKTERGRVTRAQQRWLDLLEGCGQEVHVWRPSDWGEIEYRLKRARAVAI